MRVVLRQSIWLAQGCASLGQGTYSQHSQTPRNKKEIKGKRECPVAKKSEWGLVTPLCQALLSVRLRLGAKAAAVRARSSTFDGGEEVNEYVGGGLVCGGQGGGKSGQNVVNRRPAFA